MSQRIDRVDELLRQEIGAILAKDVQDPHIGFATVTDVETTPDLRHAKVWVSVIGGPADRKETMEALARSMGFVRHELGKRLRIRRIPMLHVALDDAAERGTRVLRILDEIGAGDVEGGEAIIDAPRGESLPTPVARIHHEGDAEDQPELVIPPSPESGEKPARRGPRTFGHGERRFPNQAPREAAPQAVSGVVGAPDPLDLAAWATAVPDSVVEALRVARSVLAVGHENPDADAIGSSMGIALLVEALGGRATVAAADGVPALYAFLPGVDRVVTDPDPATSYDLVVLCDCGEVRRAGAILERNADFFGRTPLLTIDHHVSNDGTGAAAWIDPAAAATCEMVALLAARLGVPLTAADGALATLLAAGVVMDTATFAHPNATPRTFAVAAALRAAGAPISDISRRLYRTKPDAQLALFGRVLARLQRSADGRVVSSTIELADLAATGARSDHSEGIIDLLAQSETAEVALILKERGPETRLSVRTKPGGVDATVLCGTWGGGGHSRAAGASLPLPLAEASAAVLPVAARLASEVVR